MLQKLLLSSFLELFEKSLLPLGVQRENVIDGFARKANFPNVICAIDGTHIKSKLQKNTQKHMSIVKDTTHLFYKLCVEKICNSHML